MDLQDLDPQNHPKETPLENTSGCRDPEPPQTGLGVSLVDVNFDPSRVLLLSGEAAHAVNPMASKFTHIT